MILCAGEALIDMLPRQTQVGEPAFAPHAGGAVFNTAIALGRLGVQTGFFSGLSSDLFGQQLQATLEAAGVDHALTIRSPKPTTLAFVTLKDGQARYAFYDENTAGRMLHLADLPALPDQVTALFFGGISLVAEPCGSAYEALMKTAALGRLTMLDPNIRPSFITDAPSFRARLGRMLALADIVKLSDEDMAWLGGHPQDYLAGGAVLVLVTEGARGVRLYTAKGQAQLPAEKAKVVDTIGAGDTFNAGVLAGLSEAGLLTKDALAAAELAALMPAIELGIKAAAITVSRAGANPPWRKELR